MFPFRKKPLSKAELVKQGLAQGVSNLRDQVDGLHLPDLHLEAVRHQVLEAASHAAETASQAFQDASAHLGAAATRASGQLGEAASQVAEKARGAAVQAGTASAALGAAAWSKAAEKAGDAADDLKDRASDAAAQGKAAAGKAAGQAASAASDQAGKWRDQAVAAGSLAAAQAVAGAKKKFDETRVPVPEVVTRHIQPEVEISDGGSKWLWLLVGLVVGAFLALIFAPASGRKSRAVVKERLDKVSEGAADAVAAASDKAAELRHRTADIVQNLDQKSESDAASADDALITDRVHSALGHLEVVERVERLNINTERGVVIVRGAAIDANEREEIETAIRAVPGVKGVRSEFHSDSHNGA